MLSDKDPMHIKRLEKVSYRTGVPPKAIEMSLKLISEYIKNKMSSIELPDDLTEEEFNKLMPIIKLYGLGAFVPSYGKYKHIQKSKKKKNERKLRYKPTNDKN